MGDWLLRAGLLTEEQLDQALRAQRSSRGRLGEVLTAMGLVTEQQILECLSSQYDLPVADLDRLEIDPTVMRLVSMSFAQSHLILPTREVHGEIECLVADPIDVRSTDEITRVARKRARLLLATPTELYRAIHKAYAVPSSPRLSVEEGGRPRRPMKVDAQKDRRSLLKLLETNMAEETLWQKLGGR
ncbi:MAG: hypothetical protein MH204_05190 [Fimbriimonadaceae bacterium]|nr:hypothetical protein [Fimbriimonadaceae bacterium]